MNPSIESPAELQDKQQKDEIIPNVDYIQSAFSSSCGQFDVNGNQNYIVRVLKMKDSTLLFIGELGAESLDEMAMAMSISANRDREKQKIEAREETESEFKDEKEPKLGRKSEIISTTLFGTQLHSQSHLLANKLSRRYKRQFFVSCNIEIDPMIESLFQEKLADHIKKNIEKFI